MNKELYDWQEECLERWFEHNGRGIVHGRIIGGSSSQIFPQRLIPLPHKGACGNDDLYAQTAV